MKTGDTIKNLMTGETGEVVRVLNGIGFYHLEVETANGTAEWLNTDCRVA